MSTFYLLSLDCGVFLSNVGLKLVVVEVVVRQVIGLGEGNGEVGGGWED